MASALIVPYSMVDLRLPIHILSFMLFGVFLTDMMVGFLLRPKIRAQRLMPERVACHSHFTVSYHICNKGFLPAWDLDTDTLPFPKNIKQIQGMASLPALRGGSSIDVSITCRAGKRGEYIIPSLRVDSAFPFHLWRWGKTIGENHRLIVHPTFTPIVRLDLPQSAQYQPGGIAFSSDVGESMEFRGCREYRDGDNPKHIHWQSWARTGKPVVREFREEYFHRTALIMDNFVPASFVYKLNIPGLEKEEPGFEAVLSLTSAITDFLARYEFVVDFFAVGPKVYRFQGGRSLNCLENILDILACLKVKREDNFEELTMALMPEISLISGAVFLLLSWDEKRCELLRRVTEAGVNTRVLLIGDFEPDDSFPSTGTRLTSEAILSGQCVDL